MASCDKFEKSIVYVFKISRMFLTSGNKIQELLYLLKQTLEIQGILLNKSVKARENS